MAKGKFNMKLVLLLFSLGTVGILTIIPYQLKMLQNNEYIDLINISIPLLMTINLIQDIVVLFVLVLIGVRLLRRTQLSVPILDAWVHKKPIPSISKKWIFLGIGVTFIGTVLVLLLDVLFFSPLIDVPEDQLPVMTWWEGLLTIFYGGITEELMVRLFGMTLVIWIFAKITKREKEEIPSSFYCIGIVTAALIFGVAHLPATHELFGELSGIIITRALLLNGILGLWFGYLFWKKGLEYAIIAHMSADFFIHFVFNLLQQI